MSTPETERYIFVWYVKQMNGDRFYKGAFETYDEAEAAARRHMDKSGRVCGLRMYVYFEYHDIELAFPEYTRTGV